jgi:hypothetical protein
MFFYKEDSRSFLCTFLKAGSSVTAVTTVTLGTIAAMAALVVTVHCDYRYDDSGASVFATTRSSTTLNEIRNYELQVSFSGLSFVSSFIKICQTVLQSKRGDGQA